MAAAFARICRHDDDYPAKLRELHDPPHVIYVKGDPALVERVASEPAVAIVGSRRASPYGLELARTLGRELGACGVTVVSGMALGADSAAHEGALAAGGFTVAVMAGGADVPYPRSRRGLYARIAERGLVIAELPPGTAPQRWCFPARNRIMAALAAMTVVVEGTNKSGSLITAHFAADLGREVGAVPGQVTSELASGPNALLADGACVVRSAEDVLDALFGPGERRPGRQSLQPVDPQLQTLLAAVEEGRATVDAIATSPGDVEQVIAGLTELELLGAIARGPNGSYVRCAG